MGFKNGTIRVKRPGERRDYGGIATQTVVLLQDDLTPVIMTVTPCCGARYYSNYGDPPTICMECGHPYRLPGHLAQEPVVEQAPTLQQRVTRYVS